MIDENTMTALEDNELLQRYTEQGLGQAFEELVHRHLNHVYTAALRRVNGDRALAEDVTQTVFIEFARKAKRIPIGTPPGGWLHRHTGFIASNMIDKERRRRNREKEAATMNTPENNIHDADWKSAAPLLDAAMDSLPSTDRDALVLRFFEQRDFRSVGDALGISDDTAQKRVSRAIEKLRSQLIRRGVTSTGGALTALMTANSVQAAPITLVSRVTTQSLAHATNTAGSASGSFAGLDTAVVGKTIALALAVVAAVGFAGSQLSQTDSDPGSESNEPDQTEPISQADDPLPKQAIRRFGTTRYRHGTHISGLAISHDDNFAAAFGATALSGASIFDLRDGRRLTKLPSDANSVEAVAFSPDGKSLATKNGLGIKLHDPKSGAERDNIRVWTGNPRYVARWLTYSPDGTMIAQPAAKTDVQIIDVDTKKIVHTLPHNQTVRTGVFSPDGKLFAAGDRYWVRLWDVSTGKEVRRLSDSNPYLSTLAFSPDGKTLAGGRSRRSR